MKFKFELGEPVLISGTVGEGIIKDFKQTDDGKNEYLVTSSDEENGAWYKESQLIAMCNHYLVMFGCSDSPILVKAKTLKGALSEIASRSGLNAELLKKAFGGCWDDDEYIQMYNQFDHNDTIAAVYELDKPIYVSDKFHCTLNYTSKDFE